MCIFELHSSLLPNTDKAAKHHSDHHADSKLQAVLDPEDVNNVSGEESNMIGAYGDDEASSGAFAAVESVTQAWMDAVVVRSDPQEVARLFCEDGLLLATAGHGIIKQNVGENGWGEQRLAGTTIKSYFEWFARLPEQNI